MSNQQEGITIEWKEYSHTDYDMGQETVTLVEVAYSGTAVRAFSLPEVLRKLADNIESAGSVGPFDTHSAPTFNITGSDDGI